MKKWSLFILILVIVALFAFADFYTNVPEGLPKLPGNSVSGENGTLPAVAEAPNITQDILDKGGFSEGYVIEKRTRSTELFELFNLTQTPDISVYKNLIISKDPQGQLPVYIYEIHGPAGQGAITYLNIKLAIVNQLGSSEGINETGDYGFNSLFYNDTKNPSTGLLLSQVGDIVFGFKYSKTSTQAFDFVKNLINNYTSSVSTGSTTTLINPSTL